MATTKVTFANKVGIIPKTVRINQVWDDDVNEIKAAINSNADVQIEHAVAIEELQNLENDYQLVSNMQNDWQVDPTGDHYPEHNLVRSAMQNVVKSFGNTGFIGNNDTFALLEETNTSFKIKANDFPILFYNATTLDTAFKLFPEVIVPLSSVPGLTVDGIYIIYIAYDISGTVSFSNVSFSSDKNYCQLGRIAIKRVAGVVTFLDTIPSPRNVKSTPDVAGYNDLLKLYAILSSNIKVVPNANMTMKHLGGGVTGMSINWGTALPNQRTVLAANPFSFGRINPATLLNTVPPTVVTSLVTNDYWNGSAIVAVPANNNATVQRVLISDNGIIYIQMGEAFYTNLDDANTSADIAPFTDILPKDSVYELCRIVAVKNATNLSDIGQAIFIMAGDSGAGGSAPSTGTNLTYNAATRAVESDTGTDAIITLHSDTVAGLIPEGASTIYGEKTFAEVIRSTGLLLKSPSTNLQGIYGTDYGFKFSDFYAKELTLRLDDLTAVRELYAPDKTGTIAIDEDVVHLAGNEQIYGTKTIMNGVLYFKSLDSGDVVGRLARGDSGWSFTGNTNTNLFSLFANGIQIFKPDGTTKVEINCSGISANRALDVPNESGTIALTVNTTSITATAFYSTSDARLKKIIKKKYGDIGSLEAVAFVWEDSEDKEKHLGYLAQDVQKVFPEAVKVKEDGYLTVDYTAVLIAKIEALEKRVKQLENGLE